MAGLPQLWAGNQDGAQQLPQDRPLKGMQNVAKRPPCFCTVTTQQLSIFWLQTQSSGMTLQQFIMQRKGDRRRLRRAP
jgi:hypothetical protein